MTFYVLQLVSKEPLLFSYGSLYIHFVQCIKYNSSEQSRLLILTIQNLVFQIQPLYLDVDMR
jgi:hypothetical protein